LCFTYVTVAWRLTIKSQIQVSCYQYQFDSQNYFEAVFDGVNQYRFQNISPRIGNSYKRQIILNDRNHLIYYKLTDPDMGQSEIFELGAQNMNGNVKPQRKDILLRKLWRWNLEDQTLSQVLNGGIW
jgi:hypothetical protein